MAHQCTAVRAVASHASLADSEKGTRQNSRRTFRWAPALVGFCLCSAAIVCTPSSSVVPAAAATTSGCEEVGDGIQCTCSPSDNNAKAVTVVLSQNRNQLQLLCKSDLIYAPDNLAGQKVCTAEVLTECNGGSADSSIDVTTLLHDAPADLKWQTSAEGADSAKPKILTIPPANFPYVDGKFAVGCLDSTEDTGHVKCQLDVTIAAKQTVTTGQVVTCGYGEDSNPTHHEVRLTPSQNAFTLVCGGDGEILPPAYKRSYCLGGENEDAAAECPGRYADILPTYEQKWWKRDDFKGSFTLTIPTERFPREKATLRVGCRKLTQPAKPHILAAEESSVCTVDVSIKGTDLVSSSTSSRGTLAVFSMILGAGSAVSTLARAFALR